jgi:hypothetical protein
LSLAAIVKRQFLLFAGQGTEPESIALSVALGAVLGVFPVFGCPTILCTMAALALGLNLPAIQCVNYCVYPLQFALLLPFIRLGNRLFPAARGVQGIFGVLTAVLHTIVAWFCVCLPAGLLLYVILFMVLRRSRSKIAQNA